MKLKCAISLVLLTFYCSDVFAQQQENSSKKIVIEVSIPSGDYTRHHSLVNKDSVELEETFFDYITVYPNWKAHKEKINNNKIRWELYSDRPLLVRTPVLGRNGRVANPGDSVVIVYEKDKRNYFGRGIDTWELQEKVEQVELYAFKMPTKSQVHINSLEDFVNWKRYLNDKLNALTVIFNSYADKIPFKVFNLIKTIAIRQIEFQRGESFNSLYFVSKKTSVPTLMELCLIYDSTLKNKSVEWLTSKADFSGDVFVFNKMCKLQIWRKFNFDLTHKSVNEKIKRYKLYYQSFKANFRGLLRERLLQFFLFEDVVKELGYNHPSTKMYLNDYYRQTGFAKYKLSMRAFEKIWKVKYDFGESEPERKLTPQQKLAIQYDGPYVFYSGDTMQVNYCSKGRLASENKVNAKSIVLKVNTDQYPKTFSVSIKPQLQNESAVYEAPKKQLVLSDIEGNFDSFRKLLQSSGTIDQNYNWTFGDGHLICVGDFFDRGEQVTEVLWLIYSLEEKAKQAGGYVHFILGNHEILNTSGDDRYVKEKYKVNARLQHKSIKELYGEISELGKWLRTKNIIEKVGDILYTHGGISREVNNLNLSLQQMNDMIRPHYAERDRYKTNKKEPELRILFNSTISPFWYRGYYDKKTEQTAIIDSSLQKFGVGHIVTGHTIVADTVSMWYGGKVFNADTHHAEGKSEALLIEGDKFYRVNAEGRRVLLFIDDKGKLPL